MHKIIVAYELYFTGWGNCLLLVVI